MTKKRINERCPLQQDCGKTCKFEGHEIECAYYRNNACPGYEIEDQEARRYTSSEDELFEDESMSGQLTYIDVDKLYPHPDNPRKNVGDVSELAESIKANGILQNLTVVKGHYFTDREIKELTDQYRDEPSEELRLWINGKRSPEGFTVIIGHRRLAAAKAAGLTELPCAIVEMTAKEQLSTMLAENMQRVDLTVYEQAQGFQMMIDLGDTVDDIVAKSGFSASTVRRRLEIAKLDTKIMQKVSGRQLSIGDFDELAKIEDIDVRNKVLNSMGTANYKNDLQAALKSQKFAKRMAEWLEVIKTFAKEDPQANYKNRQYVRNYGYYNMHADVVIPEDAATVKYYYKAGAQQIDIYRERDEAKENAEKAEQEERQRIDEQKRSELEDISARHFDLRSDFVANLSNAQCKRHIDTIVSFVADTMWAMSQQDWHRPAIDIELLACYLHIKIAENIDKDHALTEAGGIRSAREAAPEKLAFCLAYSAIDHGDDDYWKSIWESGHYVFKHKRDKQLDMVYDTLTALGYGMSDEELQMQSGEHEVFENPEKC